MGGNQRCRLEMHKPWLVPIYCLPGHAEQFETETDTGPFSRFSESLNHRFPQEGGARRINCPHDPGIQDPQKLAYSRTPVEHESFFARISPFCFEIERDS